MNDVALVRELDNLRRRLALLEGLESAVPVSGTWTPAYTGTGTAGTFTYSLQQGAYTLIGNLVYISARVTITAIGTPPTGSMRISGLPFTCVATYEHGVTFGIISQLKFTAGAVELTGLVRASSTVISLYETFDNATNALYPAANFTNAACDIAFSAVYRV